MISYGNDIKGFMDLGYFIYFVLIWQHKLLREKNPPKR